jgi:hypothetical protein
MSWCRCADGQEGGHPLPSQDAGVGIRRPVANLKVRRRHRDIHAPVECGWLPRPAHIWRTATPGVVILLGRASGKLYRRGKLMATLEWYGAPGQGGVPILRGKLIEVRRDIPTMSARRLGRQGCEYSPPTALKLSFAWIAHIARVLGMNRRMSYAGCGSLGRWTRTATARHVTPVATPQAHSTTGGGVPEGHRASGWLGGSLRVRGHPGSGRR